MKQLITRVDEAPAEAVEQRAATTGESVNAYVTHSFVDQLLQRYTADRSDAGPIGVLGLDGATLALAQRFVLSAPLRTLDAIHLAACARFAESNADEVRLLSRDNRRNAAAEQFGIALADV